MTQPTPSDQPSLVPDLTEALVSALERIYPDRCPSRTQTDRDIWMAAGAAELVRGLRRQLEDQIKDSLNVHAGT